MEKKTPKKLAINKEILKALQSPKIRSGIKAGAPPISKIVTCSFSCFGC